MEGYFAFCLPRLADNRIFRIKTFTASHESLNFERLQHEFARQKRSGEKPDYSMSTL